MKQLKRTIRVVMSTEVIILGSLVVMVGVVVGVVAYDIFLHPAAPKPVGTAGIKISGTSHFMGEVGTLNRYGIHTIEGRAPAKVEVPYGRADYVVANMQRSSGTVEICLKREKVKSNFDIVRTCETVVKSSESAPLVMWKAPR